LKEKNMANEITIPLLPTASVSETLNFYAALGFEIIYQQTRPNRYGVVKRGDIELHFFEMKGYEPANSYSTCFVSVPDLKGLYEDFAAGLKQRYGKVPVTGIPRMPRLNTRNVAGELRFNVIDPGGNWIRFGQQAAGGNQQETEAQEQAENETRLGQMLPVAETLTFFKGDYQAAAKVLDTAFAHQEYVPDATRIRAGLLRAELAIYLEDRPLAEKYLNESRQLLGKQADQEALTEELEKVSALEEMLQ
jgi:catechol 2,3-dioxygenase-like lactoylglutathione lyase family enzyme